MERWIDVRQLAAVAAMFLIAQFAGLLLVYTSLPPQSLSGFASQTAQQGQASVGTLTYVIILAIEIVVIAAILFLVVRSYKGRNFFSIMEAYIILLGGFFFFLILIGDLFPYINNTLLLVVSVVFALSLYLSKRLKRLNFQGFRNIITLISSIGLGTFIGINLGVQFGVIALYAVLGLFAVYDYLAVFVVKFMIPMAKQAANMNLAFMIGSSEMELHPAKRLSEKAYAEKELKSIKDPKLRGMVKGGSIPMVSNIMLGNGDLMLPLLVATGAYSYTANMSLAITIIIGATAGLILTFSIIRKYKIGLPAIPPIFAMISVAMALFYISIGMYAPVLIFALAAALSLLAMYIGVKKAASEVSTSAAGSSSKRVVSSKLKHNA